MGERIITDDEGEQHIVNEGNFGTIKVNVSPGMWSGLETSGEIDVDATIIAIGRGGEVQIAIEVDGPPDYRGAGQRNTCWVRLFDGKCEFSKHWVRGKWLDQLNEAWEKNQPLATITKIPRGSDD